MAHRRLQQQHLLQQLLLLVSLKYQDGLELGVCKVNPVENNAEIICRIFSNWNLSLYCITIPDKVFLISSLYQTYPSAPRTDRLSVSPKCMQFQLVLLLHDIITVRYLKYQHKLNLSCNLWCIIFNTIFNNIFNTI